MPVVMWWGRSPALQVFALVALIAPTAARAEVPWTQDLDEGLRRASASGKDVMLLFTGRGWCGHCMVLEREVFARPAFLKELADQYVFVELDFTFGDSEQEQDREGLTSFEFLNHPL